MAASCDFEQMPTNDAVQLRITLDRLVESGAISALQADAWEQQMAHEVEAAAMREKAENEGDAEAMAELRAMKHYLFYRETTSNLLFTVPAPKPFPPNHKTSAGLMPDPSVMKHRIRSNYQHALRHEKKEEFNFASINALRRASRDLNHAKAAGSSKLFSQENKASKTMQTHEEVAELDRQLALISETQARMKSLKEAEAQKRLARAAARRVDVVRHKGEHLQRQIEAETVKNIFEDQAADSTHEALYLMREMEEDDEEGKGELDGKQESAAEQDEEHPEAETPPVRTHPALPTSHGIAVPVAVPVAVPQQVSADKATASAVSVVAPGVPPPAPPLVELSSVDVSPTISPVASRLSPELEAAPSAPGAVRVMPVSSGPELTSLIAELKELEAVSAQLRNESTQLRNESAQLRNQRDQARLCADQQKSAAQETASHLRAALDTVKRVRGERDQLRTQLEEMQAQLEKINEQDKTVGLKTVLAQERVSKRPPPSPSNVPKPRPSGPSAKPRPGNA